MKNLWKILAAMMVIALPFAVASCGSDDEEEEGPKTYEFTWDYDLGTSAVSEIQKLTPSLVNIDQAFATALNENGYKALSSSREFSKTTEKDISFLKEEIDLAIRTAKLKTSNSCQELKKGSKIIVKQKNSTKEFHSLSLN